MSEKPSRQGYATAYVKGDFDKAVYLGNPHIDNLMAALTSLGAEYWIVRRRLFVLERFLGQRQIVDPAAMEAYEPTAEEKAAWEAERDDFTERVFGVLMRPTGSVEGTMPSQDLRAPTL